MTFDILVGSRNFMRLFWVSWEDFVLHGYDCLHWVAKFCTTKAHRWLFRDSLASLRTLWSAVIKSLKFSCCGMTALARLLQEALRYFGLQADFTFRILRKVRKYTVLTGTRFHVCSRLHWRIMRRTGSVCTPLHQVSPTPFGRTFINQILCEFL